MDHRWATAGIASCTIAVATIGSLGLKVDPSPEAYLKNTAEWKFYEQIDEEYEIGETVVIGIREPGGTVFDLETMRAVAEIDRRLTRMPEVERVMSVVSAPSFTRSGETLDLRPLMDTDEEITQERANSLGDTISRHPVYRRLLVDEQHESTFILVQLSPRDRDPVRRLQTVRDIRFEVDRFRSKHRAIHLAGSAVTKEAIAGGVQHDTLLFFPAAVALLTVLLWIMFGDLISSFVPMVVVGFSSLVVVGFLAFLRVPVNMATATVPTIILVVGLADSLHFLTELRRQYARSGDRRASLIGTVEAIALPCLMTTATSAVGFFALVSSRVGPLREFGYSTAIGLIVAYIASMFFTPVLLDLFRYPRRRPYLFPAAPLLGKYMARVAVFGHRHVIITIAVTGLLGGMCIAAISQVSIDSDFVRYLDDDHRLRRDISIIERTLGGADVIEVILDHEDPAAFQQPEHLEVVDHLAENLREIEGVSRVFGLTDFLKLANATMQGEDSPGRLPDSPTAVAQLILVNPDSTSSLTDDDMSQARLSMQIRSLSSEQVIQLVIAAEHTADEALEGSNIEATFTGLPPLFATIVQNLVEDAAGSFGVAALFIWLAMLLGLRSFGLATVSMIPNVLTVGLTFGTMAILGLNFDTNSAFVACLGIGIAVDDTIHITARYQRAREEGSPSPGAAVQYAITHAGHPVVLTSLLLVVGFSVLCLSSFQPTFRVGLLSAILVGYAVLLDLVLLPILLITADRFERRYDKQRIHDREEAARFRQMSSILTSYPGEPEDD